MSHFETVKRFLDEDGADYDVVPEEPGLLAMGFAGDVGSWRIFVHVLDNGVLVVKSALDQFAPEPRRPEVIELLTRINQYLPIGCFQFDHADGEIAFTTGIDVEGVELSRQLFDNLMMGNLGTMAHHYSAIMAVCFAKMDALNALLTLENDED